jgi:hypothetical protein
MTKLFIFVSETNIALIVVKKGTSTHPSYQVIQWDMLSNTFTEGQWLCNKQLAITCCALSPNGKHFGWVYNQYWKKKDVTHAGISLVPNFTALLYSDQFVGRLDAVKFDTSSNPLYLGERGFVSRCDHELHEGNHARLADTGLKIKSEDDSFINQFGDLVSVSDFKVLINGHVVYDASNNDFTPIQPIV